MQRKQNDQLEASPDNHGYDESQLVELKIPIYLPYQITWWSYQRYNIANTKKLYLETAKDYFFKISNDLLRNNSSKKPGNSKSFRNLQTEYNQYSFILNINNEDFYQQNLWLPVLSQNLFSAPRNSPGQPPDLRYA